MIGKGAVPGAAAADQGHPGAGNLRVEEARTGQVTVCGGDVGATQIHVACPGVQPDAGPAAAAQVDPSITIDIGRAERGGRTAAHGDWGAAGIRRPAHGAAATAHPEAAAVGLDAGAGIQQQPAADRTVLIGPQQCVQPAGGGRDRLVLVDEGDVAVGLYRERGVATAGLVDVGGHRQVTVVDKVLDAGAAVE